MSSTRNAYHTHIKFLAREKLLSSVVIKQIPRSNMYRWRKELPGKYHDFGLASSANQEYELMKAFSQDGKARRIYAAYVRVIKTILTLAHTLPGFHRAVKEHSKQVVALVGRVKNLIGLKRVLRFFNISVPTFRNWSLQSLTECFESLTGACNRVFHNQLSRPEVLKLKEMVADPQFQFWPVSSIALYALRKNILPLHINTWYKYVNKFGLARARPGSRRKKNAVSARAQHPHQIWHADITIFVTADHVKHYIYAVVDNYSRKILSWLIADSVKAEHGKATIKEALKNVNAHQNITLITDGGPENNLKTFLASIDQHVDHKIALVVHYSNSLIEAHFKVLKYNYLYRMEIPDGAHLQKTISDSVEDFNKRPHISLKGLTPNEAEENVSVNKEQLQLYVKKATASRQEYNKSHRCGHCKS